MTLTRKSNQFYGSREREREIHLTCAVQSACTASVLVSRQLSTVCGRQLRCNAVNWIQLIRLKMSSERASLSWLSSCCCYCSCWTVGLAALLLWNIICTYTQCSEYTTPTTKREIWSWFMQLHSVRGERRKKPTTGFVLLWKSLQLASGWIRLVSVVPSI